MSERLDHAAEPVENDIIDSTARRIMQARYIADEILRGTKRVSLKAAKALAEGFAARDRQAAEYRISRDLTADEVEALRNFYFYALENLAPQPAAERALSIIDRITKEGGK